MRIIILSVLLVVAASTMASAQTAEHWGNYNMFFGFSYVNAELVTDRFSYNGLGANLAGYIGTNTSIVGDFSLHLHHRSLLLYTLGGVRQEFPGHTAQIFIEGLAGASYLNPQVGLSQSTFVYGGGGGIDWKIWDRAYLRIPQIDVLYGRHDGNGFTDYRIQLGGTFPF